jgi:hypothetical protein
MEDIVSRYPSLKLRVEFQGPDLTIEQLYNNFRPYGRIFDVSILSPASKELPRYATVQFTRMRSATSARNCLHGLKLEGTRLNIVYESQMVMWIAASQKVLSDIDIDFCVCCSTQILLNNGLWIILVSLFLL